MRWAVLVILGVAISTMSGCGRKESKSNPELKVPDIPPVSKDRKSTPPKGERGK